MTNVYVVECSAGMYDDYHWWIGGIFTHAQDAESLKDKMNIEAKAVLDSCPVKYDALMSDEKMTQYYDYWRENKTYANWNEATVQEYPLNQPK